MAEELEQDSKKTTTYNSGSKKNTTNGSFTEKYIEKNSTTTQRLVPNPDFDYEEEVKNNPLLKFNEENSVAKQIMDTYGPEMEKNKAEQEKNEKRRKQIATLAESLRLFSDMGSAYAGGNVYKRDKDSLISANEISNKEKQEIDKKIDDYNTKVQQALLMDKNAKMDILKGIESRRFVPQTEVKIENTENTSKNGWSNILYNKYGYDTTVEFINPEHLEMKYGSSNSDSSDNNNGGGGKDGSYSFPIAYMKGGKKYSEQIYIGGKNRFESLLNTLADDALFNYQAAYKNGNTNETAVHKLAIQFNMPDEQVRSILGGNFGPDNMLKKTFELMCYALPSISPEYVYTVRQHEFKDDKKLTGNKTEADASEGATVEAKK